MMNAAIQDPEWYPLQPEGWKMGRVKTAIESFDSGVWGEDPYNDDSSTPVIRSNELDECGNWRVTTPALRLLSPSEKKQARLREGDLLIVKSSGSHAHIGKTAVVTKEIEDLGSCFSNFTGRIRLLPYRANSRFLWYFLNNSPGRDQLFYYGTTTTGLINLSATSIGVGVFALPPLPEQERIVAYLDTTCAAIDAAVAAKRRQLETLDAVRENLIESTVTKGLRPSAPMRAVNEDWITEIPTHWEVCRIKRIVSRVDYGISESTEPEGRFPVLKMGHIQRGEIEFRDLDFVEDVADDLLLETGDLLYNRTNSPDQVGKAAIFRRSRSDAVTFASYLVRLRTNHRADPYFLNYLVNSSGFLSFARKLAIPSVQQSNLNSTRYCRMLIVRPPIDEQREIVAYLDAKTSAVSRIVAGIETQIATLNAYRKSLIHECVTGQRRVSEADLKKVKAHG